MKKFEIGTKVKVTANHSHELISGEGVVVEPDPIFKAFGDAIGIGDMGVYVKGKLTARGKKQTGVEFFEQFIDYSLIEVIKKK